MQKKIIVLFVVMGLLLTSSVVFAETTTAWSPSYNGAYFQYVNSNGGSDWDGLRWYNGKTNKMEITYTTKLSNGGVVTRVIALGGGETSQHPTAIAAGERVSSVTVKQ